MGIQGVPPWPWKNQNSYYLESLKNMLKAANQLLIDVSQPVIYHYIPLWTINGLANPIINQLVMDPTY